MNKKSNMNRPITSADALENWRKGNRERYKNRCQDPFWYAENDETIKSMASFPWNEVVGARINSTTNDVIPGIIIIPTVHCVGSGTYRYSDQMTRAADTYYQYMTQGFTGNTNDFEAPDLLMTSAAAASLLAVFLEGKRMFAELGRFAQLNEYYGRSIVTALGFDYDSFTKAHSKSDFVSDFNLRVDNFNKTIALPKSYALSDRWDYLASWIFSDNNDPEYNTLFAHRLESVLEYAPTATSTGTALRMLRVRGGGDAAPYAIDNWTYEHYFDLLDRLIDSLTGSDQNKMFGALRRVYSEDNFKHIENLSLDFTSTYVRNDVVSAAIHNADYVRSVSSVYFTDETRSLDSNVDLNSPSFLGSENCFAMIQTPKGKIRSRIAVDICSRDNTKYTNLDGDEKSVTIDANDRSMIDMFGHDVNAGNVLDITSWKLSFVDELYAQSLEEGQGGPRVWQEAVNRTEFLLYPYIYYNEIDDQGGLSLRRVLFNPYVDIEYNTSLTQLVGRFSMISHVNSSPFIRFVKNTQMSKSVKFGEFYAPGQVYVMKLDSYFGEIDTYTSISMDDIGLMHSRTMNKLNKLPMNTKSVT